MTIYPDDERELIDAAARAAGAARKRRPWSHTPTLGSLIALASCATALLVGAAAVVLVAHRPARITGPARGIAGATPATGLTGVIPRSAGFGAQGGDRYVIAVTPELSAGTAGWSTQISLTKPDGLVDGGIGSGGGYPTAADPLFALTGGASYGSDAIPVTLALTSPAVVSLRVGAETVRTLAGAGVPAGDRYVVLLVRDGGPALVADDFPAPPATGQATVRIVPLNAVGRPIATTMSPIYGSSGAYWQAPTAVLPNMSEPPYHGPTKPAPGACELAQHGESGLTPEWGETVPSISPVTGSLGELFLSCVSTEYYFHGWPLTVAALVDARHPGGPPGGIPGAAGVPGEPDLVDDETASLTARRDGNAWLVVKGGGGETVRARALAALSIAKLDVSGSGGG